jgi:AbrB family looped-hinge helix DNA binding protein
MRITTKGQVTIPLEIRERLGLLPHTEVEFYVKGNGVMLTKAEGHRRGRQLVEHMRGRGTVRMSTDEILALTREGAEGEDR